MSARRCCAVVTSTSECGIIPLASVGRDRPCDGEEIVEKVIDVQIKLFVSTWRGEKVLAV